MIILCFTVSANLWADMEKTLKSLRAKKSSIESKTYSSFATDELKYLKFYDLHQTGWDQKFGVVSSGGYAIHTHFFKSKNPKPMGTVLLVHGYLDNSGYMSNLFPLLLKKNFNVVAFDLPGHGLSTGERVDIASFDIYTNVIKDIYELAKTQFKGPYHAICHSTGCAGLMNGIVKGKFDTLDKTIFLAPLVRSVSWKLAKFGNKIGRRFLTHVPRKFNKNSSDKSYLRFVKNDPLQVRKIPLRWVTSLHNWEKSFSKSKPNGAEILVISGDKDATVDWAKNREILSSIFTKIRYEVIDDANHQLINEMPIYMNQVLKLVESNI